MNRKSRGLLIASVFAGMLALAIGFAGLLAEPSHVGLLWGGIGFAILGIALAVVSQKGRRTEP